MTADPMPLVFAKWSDATGEMGDYLIEVAGMLMTEQRDQDWQCPVNWSRTATRNTPCHT